MNPVRASRPIDRRDFLKATAASLGVVALADAAVAPLATPRDLIDTNVYLSRWPVRRLPHDDTAALVAKLRSQGVTQAWVGSFDGLLHRDLAAVNARLADECRRHGPDFLVPFGSINPKLPDWEDDLRRCAEEHRMPGIRLHPSYHGCTLDDPSLGRLLELAARRGLVVQIAALMEDRRMMHPLFQVDPPDFKPLAAVVAKTPALKLELLNSAAVLRGPPLLRLINAGEVFVDLATLEGVGGVGNLLTQVPAGRVLFGSNSPLFYFESALLKLQESPLTDQQLLAIRCESAARLLTRITP